MNVPPRMPPPGMVLHQGPPPPPHMIRPGPPPPGMTILPSQHHQPPPGGPPGGPPPGGPPRQQGPAIRPHGPPLLSGKHIPLARCRVLYLGSAVPLETALGLEALQQPLRERYSGDDENVPGIDAWLTVYSSGLQMEFVDDPDNVQWFPIQTLHVCAAVKCVVQVNGNNGERVPRFVALDSADAQNSIHPPMFATIMRRTKGVKVLECHSFICKCPEAAMALVQMNTHAYEHKEGWTDDAPAVDAHIQAETRLVPAPAVKTESAPPEFYQKPPENGYFYTTDRELVKEYNVMGGKPPRPQAPPTADPGRPTSPGLGPRPTLIPLPNIPTHPGEPMPMRPMLPPMVPGMPPPMIPGMPPPMRPQQYMPVPPPGYFRDMYKSMGQPIAVFGGGMGSIDPRDGGRRQRRRRHGSRGRYREQSPHYRSDDSYSSSSSSSESDDDSHDRHRRSRHRSPDDRRHNRRPMSNDRDRGRRDRYRDRDGDRNRDRDYDYHRDRNRDRDYGREKDYGRDRDYGRDKDYGHYRDRREGDYDRRDRGRPRTPPIDYRENTSDLQIFAKQYNNYGDEYFYGKNRETSPRREGEYQSRFNPEVVMKRDDNKYDDRRGYDTPPRRASPRRGRSPSPRQFPRQDRNFARSMAEERRATGGHMGAPDAYDQFLDNASDYGPPTGHQKSRMSNMDKTLGYYP